MSTQTPGIVAADSIRNKLNDLKSILAPDATDAELELFALYCQKSQLDPFSRQIHFVKRGGKVTFQTSIDGYRAIAERTNLYAGSSDPIYDEGITQYEHIKSGRGFPMTATVAVSKVVQGQVFEIVATAEWKAYCPSAGSDFMWKKMPYLMLGKVAEALALRKAFPNAFSGLYVNEEMEQAVKPIEIKEEKFVPVTEKAVVGDDEEVDLAKDAIEQIELAKNKTEVMRVVDAVKELHEGGLITDEELKTIKLAITNKKYGEPK